jgi:hypothetical protein
MGYSKMYKSKFSKNFLQAGFLVARGQPWVAPSRLEPQLSFHHGIHTRLERIKNLNLNLNIKQYNCNSK